VAFGEGIRTALRPYVEHKNAHPEIAGELQEQADRALRHFSREGDLKRASLLMWAGANPRHLLAVEVEFSGSSSHSRARRP